MMHRRFPTVIGRLSASALHVIAAGTVLVPLSAVAERVQPQVQIETKFVEVTQSAAEELGFDTRLAQKLGALSLASPSATSPASRQFGLSAFPSANAIGARLFPSDGQPGTIKISGLLTPPQYQILIDAIIIEKSAKIVSAPTLRTPIDEKAVIAITSSIVLNQGTTLEIVPRIGPDGYTIELTTVLKTQDLSKPAGNATIDSGQTLVFGGFVPQGPEKKQNLILLITPQRVDTLSSSTGGAADQVEVEPTGTGETIGHVADLKMQNLTNEPLSFTVPAFVLESKSGANQATACPYEQNVALGPLQAKIVPVNGVCVNRDKPPAGKGVTGDLVMNVGDATVPANPEFHFSAKQVGDLLRICGSIYDAADQLQQEGALKDFPYKDKQQQKDILVQWTTWTNASVCEISQAPLATKDDLKKVAYKQVEQKGAMTSDTRKKIDKGIDTISEKVELTLAKAKDLEKPEQSTNQTLSPVLPTR